MRHFNKTISCGFTSDKAEIINSLGYCILLGNQSQISSGYHSRSILPTTKIIPFWSKYGPLRRGRNEEHLSSQIDLKPPCRMLSTKPYFNSWDYGRTPRRRLALKHLLQVVWHQRFRHCEIIPAIGSAVWAVPDWKITRAGSHPKKRENRPVGTGKILLKWCRKISSMLKYVKVC